MIVGAGMAGLLAANMLRHRNHPVLERQADLPNNHSAVLRFKSSIVGDTLGIPFRKERMIKAALPWMNPVADALSQSFKTTGVLRSDRSITQGLVVADRYIAPPDLIERMGERVSIRFNSPVRFDESGVTSFISTIPMPVLMDLLRYPLRKEIEFIYQPGYNVRARVTKCDAYISLLDPRPEVAWSRISITGDELVVECHQGWVMDDPDAAIAAAAKLLGISPRRLYDTHATESQYAKILPIPEEQRRDFIYWATDKHNVFSLGRFATWRPGLLLDDLVNDIRLIDSWLDRKNRYAAARAR